MVGLRPEPGALCSTACAEWPPSPNGTATFSIEPPDMPMTLS